ncbi:unnamed protein product [Caenorhabditis auriculariae]|uniref:DUF7774 domain-containing protein n=1 Tax=Caenorhabditis auriculariae TaxID=2777116 RepID=A0A8S1HLJ9_9PELO|nr:unnamed protein product [Caenorhabditis auriculariae]
MGKSKSASRSLGRSVKKIGENILTAFSKERLTDEETEKDKPERDRPDKEKQERSFRPGESDKDRTEQPSATTPAGKTKSQSNVKKVKSKQKVVSTTKEKEKEKEKEKDKEKDKKQESDNSTFEVVKGARPAQAHLHGVKSNLRWKTQTSASASVGTGESDNDKISKRMEAPRKTISVESIEDDALEEDVGSAARMLQQIKMVKVIEGECSPAEQTLLKEFCEDKTTKEPPEAENLIDKLTSAIIKAIVNKSDVCRGTVSGEVRMFAVEETLAKNATKCLMIVRKDLLLASWQKTEGTDTEEDSTWSPMCKKLAKSLTPVSIEDNQKKST